jgi:hypothetical protein
MWAPVERRKPGICVSLDFLEIPELKKHEEHV